MDIEDDEQTILHFNGIDADTGAYLCELSTAELAKVAAGETLERKTTEPDHRAELKGRADRSAHWGVKEGVDATKLEEAGWAVIFPFVAPGSDEACEQDAIIEALSPLLALRKAQASKLADRYKEYRGTLGFQPNETKARYLARLGRGAGPADPDIVPYYLLIVASPQVIPFSVQYQLDVQYAVGRIHFDTIEEYANYARSVVAAEQEGFSLARDIAFVGVSNPDDAATQLSRKHLVGPLSDLVEVWAAKPDEPELHGWGVRRYFDEDASKAKVSELFGGPKTPALLFSGSHGMGFQLGNPLQERHQGALLLQDWQGPKRWRKPIGEDLYLSADDLRSDAGLLGMINFNFACYGGGTPQYDEFSKQAFKERKPIAEKAFVSNLHRKLLSHPKGGALASIGHVERAWGYSFMQGGGRNAKADVVTFESTLMALLKGVPVGAALEGFNGRYAELASEVAAAVEQLDFNPGAIDAYSLAAMWTASNDARGYAITGDPAVRLRLANPGDAPPERHTIDLSGAAAPEPAPAQAAPSEASSDPARDVNYGWFDKDKDEPNGFERFVEKVAARLERAIDDAMNLEVRTYVSRDPNAAAAAERATLASTGDLRAFTRIALDGDTDAIVPERDGKIDHELWKLHLELVAQAQAVRAETMRTLVMLATGITKSPSTKSTKR